MTDIPALPIEIEPSLTRDNTVTGLTGPNYQWIYRFTNGYGASIIQGPYSYGGPDGKYELAVLAFSGDDSILTYDTPVTDDVLGHLDIPSVAVTLAAIAALPDNPGAYQQAKRKRDELRGRLRRGVEAFND